MKHLQNVLLYTTTTRSDIYTVKYDVKINFLLIAGQMICRTLWFIHIPLPLPLPM